jgi:hypothetical protein
MWGRALERSIKGNRYNTITEAARATTPPNLSGIERRIEYAKRKYHSG